MPPDSKVSKQAMLSARIKGTVIELPNSATLKLTGEKLSWAIAGFPTVNCHHGTKTEAAISKRVEIPATKAIMLTLFFVDDASLGYWDASDVDGLG